MYCVVQLDYWEVSVRSQIYAEVLFFIQFSCQFNELFKHIVFPFVAACLPVFNLFPSVKRLYAFSFLPPSCLICLVTSHWLK